MLHRIIEVISTFNVKVVIANRLFKHLINTDLCNSK